MIRLGEQQRPGSAQALTIIDGGQGDVPLKDLKFRCTQCGSRRGRSSAIIDNDGNCPPHDMFFSPAALPSGRGSRQRELAASGISPAAGSQPCLSVQAARLSSACQNTWGGTHMTDFAGRTAVVTGGGSGMGRELVRQLVAEDCNVAMCDVSPTGLAET